MALREIIGDKDKVSINGSNQIYGGYIFNGSVSFGFSNNKTTISVSVVSENGNYLIPAQDLNTSDPQVIQFGENIVIDPAFLYEYSIEKRGDSRILQLTYVDGSILLDKIFIGLNYEHGFAQEDAQNKYLDAEFKCHPCPGPSTQRRTVIADEDGLLKDGARYLPITTSSRQAKADQKTINTENKWKGGYLILGDENFEPNSCKIPKIDYNFTQLKNLLEVNGIKLENLKDVNPNYRQAHVGTLREVLGYWCSDFGYSFYWNSLKNLNTATSTDADIVGLDLSFPISLTSTKTSLEVIDADASNETVITSLNERFSLENTKKVYHLSSFKKESSTERRPWTIYKGYTAKAVTVQDLCPTKSVLLGRTYDQFIISCVLSKYNTSLRDIYNMQILKKGIVIGSTEDAYTAIESSNIDPRVLGFERLHGAFFHSLDKDKQEEFFGSPTVFVKEIGRDGLSSSFPYITGSRDLNASESLYDFYIGTYNEDYLSDLKSYEARVADFIGKHYTVPNYWNPFHYCSYEESFNLDVGTTPSSEVYNPYGDSERNSPFSELTRESVNSNVIGSDSRVFERDSTYGTSHERLEEILIFNDTLTSIGGSNEHTEIDIISNYDTEVNTVSDEVKTEIASDNDNVKDKLDKEGKNLRVLATLREDVLNYVVRIGDLYQTQNSQESWSSSEETEDGKSECETVCEYDLIEEICRCTIDQFGNKLSYDGKEVVPPYEGLSSRQALAFDVTALLSDSTSNQYYNAAHKTAEFKTLTANEIPLPSLTRTIILPTQSDYQMYFKLDFERESTMPKVTQIKGSISDGGGLASVEVVSEDITDRIESYYNSDNDEITTNVFLPGTASIVPRTTQEYHDQRVTNLTTGVGEPQHTINVSFAGLDSSYANFINPKSGLTSFNVNFSEGTMNVDLEFSNRPLELPKPDAVSKSISPRLYNLTPNTL
jgi:hypothetical protein